MFCGSCHAAEYHLPCTNMTLGRNYTNASLIQNLSNHDSVFYLYQSAEPVDWCQAYRACQTAGLQLAVGQHSVTQKLWSSQLSDPMEVQQTDNHQGDRQQTDQYLWVSSRRIVLGDGWTWLDENLSSCKSEHMFGCEHLTGVVVFLCVFLCV